MLNPVHFSSKTDAWSTPEKEFRQWEAEFGPFDLDPCATAENAKAPKFYTKEDDGLTKDWCGKVWVNCPYGRGITGRWVAYALHEIQANASLIVMLLPARTDTAWFQRCLAEGEVRFIKGRLKFGGAANSAPFPSALVVFRRAP